MLQCTPHPAICYFLFSVIFLTASQLAALWNCYQNSSLESCYSCNSDTSLCFCIRPPYSSIFYVILKRVFNSPHFSNWFWFIILFSSLSTVLPSLVQPVNLIQSQLCRLWQDAAQDVFCAGTSKIQAGLPGQEMSSVQQEVVGRIQFCPHDHMIDTGHAGNCGRASQLICDTSRRMVLEFLPGMQVFSEIQSRPIHETYIHHFALYYSAVTLGACRSVCGPGVALTATFVHVKVQCVPQSLATYP